MLGVVPKAMHVGSMLIGAEVAMYNKDMHLKKV